MAIQVLTKEVRELIAAGEVVERPASVVKELVENAIDAGATTIEIELRRSGLSRIRVTDNGCGVARDEVPTAFLRHATSKVENVDDLSAIGTLGFRGEALAAICAVAKVRFLTKQAGAQSATDYRIEAGETVGDDEAGGPNGTSVYVDELFFNTPARMKFLKKDVSEGNAVQTIAEQLALSHPEIAFKLIREDKVAFATPGDGDLFAAIHSIFPRDITADMVAVQPLFDKIQVTGYCSNPQQSRASRSLQYVFVNGRFVKSQSASAAAEEACRGLLMQGKHPAFVLYINLPHELVDVNVHPAKTEVRFQNDREVFSAIYAAVKMALTGYASNFSHQIKQTAPTEEGAVATGACSAAAEQPELTRKTSFGSTTSAVDAWDNNDGQKHEVGFAGFVPEDVGIQRDAFLQMTFEQAAKAYENRGIDIEYTVPLKKQSNLDDEALLQRALREDKPSDHIIVIGELFSTYIVAQLNDNVLFIDKHAAHERILFEQFNQTQGSIDRQILLEPVVVSLALQEKQALLDERATVEKIGFFLDDFGENEVAVREIPSYFVNKDVAGAVTEIAVQLSENGNEITTAETEWLLHSIACRAAIKAGHRTARDELIQLVADILDNEIPKFCPHGRPVYFAMSKQELEKRFGRT